MLPCGRLSCITLLAVRPGFHLPWMSPRARAVGAECWADPPEKRVLSVGGEEPKDITAVSTGDTPCAGQAPAVSEEPHGLRSRGRGWDTSIATAGCSFVAGHSPTVILGTSAPVCVPLALRGTPLGLRGSPGVALALAGGDSVTQRRYFSTPLCCSDEEGSWLPARGADCVDAQPPESKIRSL